MKVLLDGKSLTIQQVVAVAREFREVELSNGVIPYIEKSASIIDEFLKNNKKVYGVTTGFGALADTIIPKEKLHELQYNIILSHASAVGDPLPTEIVRAAMLLRANTFATGCCGVRLKTVRMVISMLNKGIHPIVPEKGSLGASGDLAPLAHIALVMIGRGTAEYKGKIFSGLDALKQAGLEPLELEAKEGLSLVNGTQIMTAIGTLAIHDSIILLKNSDIAAAMASEVLRSSRGPFDEKVHRLRPHPGQLKCAANILSLVNGSKLIGTNSSTQDPYSVRCIPQVNGAVYDTIEFCKKIIETEINSVTDNPIILKEEKSIVSCGHFHGEYLAFALDFLGISISELASISERRIARLVDPKLSGLAPFLIKDSGVNSGFMIPHYTAASLVSENKVLAHPASVDSIPTSANQEDHVSMGGTAANKLLRILFNVQNVIAIEYLCAAQALDLLKESPGKGTAVAHKKIREKVHFLEKDDELHKHIKNSFELVKSGEIVKEVEKVVGGLR